MLGARKHLSQTLRQECLALSEEVRFQDVACDLMLLSKWSLFLLFLGVSF